MSRRLVVVSIVLATLMGVYLVHSIRAGQQASELEQLSVSDEATVLQAEEAQEAFEQVQGELKAQQADEYSDCLAIAYRELGGDESSPLLQARLAECRLLLPEELRDL